MGDFDRRAVDVAEQFFLDHAIDGVVVRMSVEQIDRTIEDAQERIQVMCDHEDRDAQVFMQAAEQSHDFALSTEVQGGQRLVQDEQLGRAASAAAIATRWRWPPESRERRLPASSAT